MTLSSISLPQQNQWGELKLRYNTSERSGTWDLLPPGKKEAGLHINTDTTQTWSYYAYLRYYLERFWSRWIAKVLFSFFWWVLVNCSPFTPTRVSSRSFLKAEYCKHLLRFLELSLKIKQVSKTSKEENLVSS